MAKWAAPARSPTRLPALVIISREKKQKERKKTTGGGGGGEPNWVRGSVRGKKLEARLLWLLTRALSWKRRAGVMGV